MSSTGQHAAFAAVGSAIPKGRSPLAHLLHALNQPLTGLQCSLELAAAGPRRPEQYLRTLRESLDLASRMRILVEALRDLTDAQQPDGEETTIIFLDTLLRATVDDLRAVAEARNVRLRLECEAALPVRSGRRRLREMLFRFLDSVLTLTREGSNLGVAARREWEQSLFAVSFEPAPPPEHSPFSRAELGLLITQAAWEQAGGEWSQAPGEKTQVFTLRPPLAAPSQAIAIEET